MKTWGLKNPEGGFNPNSPINRALVKEHVVGLIPGPLSDISYSVFKMPMITEFSGYIIYDVKQLKK